MPSRLIVTNILDPPSRSTWSCFAHREGQLVDLLVQRGREPFAGSWAVPGGFLDIDEEIEVGVRRELREETGLELPGPVTFLGIFGTPGRDPRGRTISLAYVAYLPGDPPAVTGGDDAARPSGDRPPRRPRDPARLRPRRDLARRAGLAQRLDGVDQAGELRFLRSASLRMSNPLAWRAAPACSMLSMCIARAGRSCGWTING